MDSDTPKNELQSLVGGLVSDPVPLDGSGVEISSQLFVDIAGGLRGYTPEQAILAAATWVVTGSSRKTEKVVNIPAATIRCWYRTPWWRELVQVVRRAKQEELDAKLTGVIMSAAEQVADRVENGDYSREEGETVRIPMKGTDLAKVTGIIYDKRAMLRANPLDKANIKNASIEESLKKLALAFGEMSRKANEKVIEGERVA